MSNKTPENMYADKDPLDMTEAEALEYLKGLSPEDLDQVHHDRFAIACSVRMCKRRAGIAKDFGVSPWFLTGKEWKNLSALVYFCPGHYKKRLRISWDMLKPGPALNHIQLIKPR